MARRSILSEEPAPEINLSPMIDCIFILLIFFIVTTVFVQEKGLQVNKPDVAASAAFEDKQSLTLSISEDDRVWIGKDEIAIGDVANRVREAVDEHEPVVIRAHAKSDHGVFVAVWDAAKRGGAADLSFSTVN